jgi:site-specific DNA recombinase
MAEKPTRAVVYARISDDTEGRAAGVERQVEDCKALAERLGWLLCPDADSILIDNDLSASTRSKARRPAFDRLLEGVATGVYDGLLYYSNSRLTRRPREYETIIELVENTGVRLASVASGTADLTTADGRMIGRMLAAQDAAEAERIGERVTRAMQHRRDTIGLPSPIRRAFGYAAGGKVVIPEEADAIRLGAKLILDGASLREVGRVWMGRGITPLEASYWNGSTVKRVITRPRVAGLIEHKGEIIGEGQFEAILDRDTWERVRAAVSDRSSPSRAQYKGRQHLLSGLLFCGLCGHRVKVNALRDDQGQLRPESFVACLKSDGQGCGRVRRKLETLEAYVFAVVDARLANMRPLDPAEDATAETRGYARLVAEREAVEARIGVLRDQYANGDIESVDFVPLLRSMRSKIATLEAQLRDFEVTGSELSSDDVQEAWRSGSFEDRREILELVIAQITLHPIGKVGPVRAKLMVPETTEIAFA